MTKEPVRCLITGAAGQIGYSLIPLFCSGEMLGADQPVILHLLDIPRAKEALEGVALEIDDCSFPLLQKVVVTTNVEEGFKDVEVCALVGGFPRLPGMSRADLLSKNRDIFVEQGAALGKFAKENCKILVVANPANTNCLVAYKSCVNAGGKIPKGNFTCLTRLDMNRAKSQLRLKAPAGATVKNVIIWGNHSADQCPDYDHAVVTLADGSTTTVPEALKGEEEFLNNTFTPLIQNRGAQVLQARGKSSAMSAANAIKDHLRDWVLGSDEILSMGVISESGNAYGIAEDLTFSVPVKCSGGAYSLVTDLTLSEKVKAQIKVNEEALKGEKEIACKGL